MLCVWLPLNGDLRNQGCSNPNISLASGNTWTSSGKIGNSSLTLTKIQTILPTSSCMTGAKEISYCYWVKVNTAWSTNWLDGIRWIETDGSATSTARQEFYTNCTLVGTWYKGGAISGKAFTPGVWTHLAATINYNTGEAKFYINGILSGTATNVDTTYYCRGDFYIGDNGVDICQNDVRIYDHCLSAAEIKEISQGLVLHYKLNQPIGLTDAILNQDTYSVYNNYAGSGTTGTLTNLSETFNGHVVRREVMTPNDTSINNFKGSLGSHGVYGHRQTFLANTKYVFWIYYRPISHTDIRVGGVASNIGGWTEVPPIAVGDGWYRVGQYRNGTVTTDKTDSIFTSFYTPTAASGVPITIDWAAPHLLVGTTEIPDDDSFMGNDYIEDSSGYGHHGEIVNTLSTSNDTPRYNACTHINATNQKIKISNFPTSGFSNSYSFSWWAKISSVSPMHWGFADGIRLNGMYTGRLWNTGDSSNNPLYTPGTTTQVAAPTVNAWHHWVMTGDGTTCKVYQDGVYWGVAKTYKAISGQTIYINGWDSGTSYCSDNYSISDFRIYATALSADDVLTLYHTGAKIDNKGNTHAYEFVEHQDNILFPVELSRTKLEFTNGLSRYTQSNCQVTLVEEGYHIYRPPNLTTSANGNTMFGGLKLVNQSTDTVSPYNAARDNIWNLQKGHSYILAFHAKGQSSNAHNYLSFNNNMGWGVGGVSPTPTLIAANGIPADFQGEKDCYYAFTINDDIVKTSNDARAGYDGSSQYLSYRHFTFGWTYSNTGSLGTDIYLINFRLYDITTHIAQFTKQGIANFSQFIEQMDKAQIRKNSELLSSEFIEL